MNAIGSSFCGICFHLLLLLLMLFSFIRSFSIFKMFNIIKQYKSRWSAPHILTPHVCTYSRYKRIRSTNKKERWIRRKIRFIIIIYTLHVAETHISTMNAFFHTSYIQSMQEFGSKSNGRSGQQYQQPRSDCVQSTSEWVILLPIYWPYRFELRFFFHLIQMLLNSTHIWYTDIWAVQFN